jgi:endonuclease YncB( thermonuclease family)
VIDGDGLEIRGEKIRLFGIDAPEIDQYCQRADGTRWRCGHYASVELDRIVAGSDVTCVVRDTDRYGRPVAACTSGEVDLGEAQVRSGWAVAYRRFTRQYDAAENAARAARRGVWQGKFDMPWAWRERTRKTP